MLRHNSYLSQGGEIGRRVKCVTVIIKRYINISIGHDISSLCKFSVQQLNDKE